MIKELAIRMAEHSDATCIALIREAAILELAAPTIGKEAAEDWVRNADPARVSNAIHEHDVWVAIEGKMIVGWVEINDETVEALYVAPPRAGRGIGSALLSHAEQIIARAGMSMVVLEASPNGFEFYVSKDYRQTGEPDEKGAIPMAKKI